MKRLIVFEEERAIYTISKPRKPVAGNYYGLIRHSTQGLVIPVEMERDMSQLASESDVVIVGCGLTPSTRHLTTTDFFNRIRKTAVIVNISRDPIIMIDTNALIEALARSTIFGAGLDVIEGEPNMQAGRPILKQPRCVLLPHIGSATIETREQMALESVKNLLAGLKP